MKQAMLNMLKATGAFAPFRFANRNKALVVTYHRFTQTEEPLSTSARAFNEQVAYLAEHYRIVPLSDLAKYLSSGRRLPPGVAAITIDDGYSDAYEIAYPILRRYDVPAAIFVVTGFVDRTNWLWTDKLRYLALNAKGGVVEATVNHFGLPVALGDSASRLEVANHINSVLKAIPNSEKEEAIGRIAASLGVQLPSAPPSEFSALTWDQVREMDTAGIEIGSHTVTHPILTNITPERLRLELCQSRLRLEEMLCRKVELFCYPNGDYDLSVQSEVERAGYKCAATSRPGFNDSYTSPLLLKRIHTEPDMVHFVQSTSGFEQVKNKLRGISAVAGAATDFEYISDLWL